MAFSVTCSTYQLDKPILQSLTSTGVATAVHEPGFVVTADDGRKFQYVQFDSSSVAAVAGAPVVWAITTADNEFVATSDVSDGKALACGCFLSILTDTYFGWIQTKGFVKDVPCSGAQAEVAAGDMLYAEDAVWKTGTVGTQHAGAVALEASTSSIANIMLLNS